MLAAEAILTQNPNMPEPWFGGKANLNRESYHEHYLLDKKRHDPRGYAEAEKGNDYWGDFKDWTRQETADFWSSWREDEGQPATDANTDRRTRREHIPKSVKQYVWQRDQSRCANCGSKEKLEYDHIIPVSKGGSNTERNLQLLCERCNRSKGATIA
jgi:hypothetical protein